MLFFTSFEAYLHSFSGLVTEMQFLLEYQNLREPYKKLRNSLRSMVLIQNPQFLRTPFTLLSHTSCSETLHATANTNNSGIPILVVSVTALEFHCVLL